MATENYSYIYKSDDKTWIEIADRVADVLSHHEVKTTFYAANEIAVPRDELEESELQGSYTLSKITIRIEKESTNTQRSYFYFRISRTVFSKDREEPSSIYDGITYVFEPRATVFQFLSAELLSINRIVSDYGNLKGTPPKGFPEQEDTLRQLMVGFGASHEKMLTSLQDQISELAQRRLSMEDDFRRKEDERSEAHRQALEELDKERQKLLLQSHRSERRRLLHETISREATNLRKSITPKSARLARWAIFFAALLLALLSAMFAIESMYAIGSSVQSGPGVWYLLLRSALSTFVAIGSLVYAASWLRSFYSDEIIAVREIDRFNYDMIRASWAIETFLEVKKEHEVDIPDEWIQSVTRGLFDGAASKGDLDEGTRALRALMGFTASGSFGPNGAQVDINRKDARKLAKANGDGD